MLLSFEQAAGKEAEAFGSREAEFEGLSGEVGGWSLGGFGGQTRGACEPRWVWGWSCRGRRVISTYVTAETPPQGWGAGLGGRRGRFWRWACVAPSRSSMVPKSTAVVAGRTWGSFRRAEHGTWLAFLGPRDPRPSLPSRF